MKFGTMMHLSFPNLTKNQKFKKKSRSKMADSGRLENRKIAIFQKPFGQF